MSGSSDTQSDSWETRIQTAATALGLDTQVVEDGLASPAIGISAADGLGIEMLSDGDVLRFADFASVFGEDGQGVAMGRVRLAYNKLQKGDNGQAEKASELDTRKLLLKSKYGVKGSLKNARVRDLLEDYHPEEKDDPITKELKNRFGNDRVIVLDPVTDKVDVEATLDLITDIEDGMATEGEVRETDTGPSEPVRVGFVPNQVLDEDPLYTDSPLRRNGRSAHGHRFNWNNVSEDARKLVRVLASNGLNGNDRSEVRDFIKEAASQNFDELLEWAGEEYPEGVVEYRKLQKRDDLPSLKIAREDVGKSKANNPFGGNRKY